MLTTLMSQTFSSSVLFCDNVRNIGYRLISLSLRSKIVDYQCLHLIYHEHREYNTILFYKYDFPEDFLQSFN